MGEVLGIVGVLSHLHKPIQTVPRLSPSKWGDPHDVVLPRSPELISGESQRRSILGLLAGHPNWQLPHEADG